MDAAPPAEGPREPGLCLVSLRGRPSWSEKVVLMGHFPSSVGSAGTQVPMSWKVKAVQVLRDIVNLLWSLIAVAGRGTLSCSRGRSCLYLTPNPTSGKLLRVSPAPLSPAMMFLLQISKYCQWEPSGWQPVPRVCSVGRKGRKGHPGQGRAGTRSVHITRVQGLQGWRKASR